jgi:hypothetical protein
MLTRTVLRSRLIFSLIILAALGLSNLPGSFPGVDDEPQLIINELLAANQSGLTDEAGAQADWIELYNPGRQAINLAGWSLSDDPAQPEKWPLPGMTLGGGQYLVIFASGQDRRPTEPKLPLHANFRLDQAGEFLGLYNAFQGRFADIVLAAGSTLARDEASQFPQQFPDVAYGRYPARPGQPAQEMEFGYLARPTPGQPNEERRLWAGLVEPAQFSPERGFYETPFLLELSTPTPGATIRYTTDGSQPTEQHGLTYSGPIPIQTTTLVRALALKPGFRPAAAVTHSFIFPVDVLSQPSHPAGFPKTWGGYEGSPVLADYELDPEIVNHPSYAGRLKAALTSLPALSLVTDMRSFHDLYANPTRRGRAWERPVSVELIEPGGERAGFQVNAGLRIQGELGRSEFIPKRSFRLFFRREYGAGRLRYPLFPGSPVQEFDTLILRGGVNRSYAGYSRREDDLRLTTYTRDEWLRASQLAMSGYGVRGRFVHLYLNGLYWGLYNLVERPDAAYMAAYFGGAETEWQAFNQGETLTHGSERFKTLHQLAGAGQLDDPERYALIKSYLDIPDFIDYLILNWYSGNLDWAFNNWYAAVRNPAGPVRYFVWDGERTWYEGAEIYMELDEYLGRPNLVKPLFEALMENPDFRMELADRLYKHLQHGGALTDEQAQARWRQLNQVVEQAIIAESARWGDTHRTPPLTQQDWFEAADDVLAQMEGNAARLLELARAAGYYPELEPPRFKRQGGPVAPGFRLELSLATSEAGPAGLIYYTTDGSDPRLAVTSQVAPAASVYHTPLLITQTTRLRARVYRDQSWSALAEAVFTIGDETASPLQITEIMYNPAGGDDYEFLVLRNGGQVDLELAGLSFEGIAFTFPAMGVEPLRPGGELVLVRNPAAFARRYPDRPIGGVYQGRLSNEGEEIMVKDAQGEPLVSVAYDDENGWPLSPDGRGDSLILVQLDGDANDPAHWRASSDANGPPGAAAPMVEIGRLGD